MGNGGSLLGGLLAVAITAKVAGDIIKSTDKKMRVGYPKKKSKVKKIKFI